MKIAFSKTITVRILRQPPQTTPNEVKIYEAEDMTNIRSTQNRRKDRENEAKEEHQKKEM